MTSKEGERLSCGIVLARYTDVGWMTLMLRAFSNWDFPKGICEADETPLDAAKREVAEETSISELSFDWGEQFVETGPYDRGKTARYYLAQTTQGTVEMGYVPALGRAEHHEYRWVNFDEAYDLGSPRVRTVVVWARQIIGT